MRERKRRGLGDKELEDLGRTPDRPWGLMEEPLGHGDSHDAFAPFRDAFGGNNRARLAWLLDSFVYADLKPLSLEARIGLFRVLEELIPSVTRRRWSVDRPAPRVVKRVGRRSPFKEREKLAPSLRALIERWPRGFSEAFLTRPADPGDVLAAAQGAARESIETVAGGGLFMIGQDLEKDDHGAVGDSLPSSRTRAFAGPVRISLHTTTGPTGLSVLEQITAPLPDGLVVAILALLVQVSPAALGRCPYAAKGTPCGGVFVKRGPQKWCRDHQKIVRGEQLRKAFDKFQKKTRRSRRKGGTRP